jgi:BioD-like phosphotransacetylase family protein
MRIYFKESCVPIPVKHLLVGSTESYSGKSATILGIAQQLQSRGFSIGYGKPIGTCLSESPADTLDEDVRFIGQTLNLPVEAIRPTLFSLTPEAIRQRLLGEKVNYAAKLAEYAHQQTEDLVLFEGPGSLQEGQLFGLSLLQMAETLDAQILLIARYHSPLVVEPLMSAQEQLGDRLAGILLNDIPMEQLLELEQTVKPFLEAQGMTVLGMLPRSQLLRSVSVKELVHQLDAEVLCRADRLDLLVEELRIGAMNVNSALKYFRKANNMAVVTGGDRADIQLAALETSTHCLILTGQLPPNPTILERAADLEIPVLSVDLDTLTTVEIIDRAFGQVRVHETVKVECVREMIAKHFKLDQLLAKLHLTPVGSQRS